jgi:hypothetical protein
MTVVRPRDRIATAIAMGGVALAVLSPGAASADPARNIQAAARILTFLENGPTGRMEIGIVFDPATPGSVAEKNAIMAALGGGYVTGAVTIVGKPMEAGDVGGVMVLFLTRGVNYARVGAKAQARRVFTIGSDSACVRSGDCIVGISTDPAVEIVINHRAAIAAGASFNASFRMMIREI